MAPLQTVLLLFGLQSGFMHIMSLIMQPIYWAVSGIIVGFHKLWAPVTGQDSGLTWVLTIVSLVVLIRTLLIPIFVKQINASRNMQLIQPKVKALQDKYGSDRERLGQETMKLYKEEGVNPAASCLPALLQMPIFLALFRVLQGAASDPIVARGHFFKINPDLVQSLHDANFLGAQLAGRFLPLNQGFGATQIMATVLIILMSLVLFIQQRELMQRNMPPEALVGPMAQQQKMMLYFFPVFYAFTGISIPIGVLIYWMTTNVWTLGQQYILIHNNPTPGTPAYVDWEDRMRKKGLDPHQIEADRRAKRLRTTVSVTPAAVEDEDGSLTVARQGVTRQTVRRTADGGQQVVQRQQPKNQARGARKKK